MKTWKAARLSPGQPGVGLGARSAPQHSPPGGLPAPLHPALSILCRGDPALCRMGAMGMHWLRAGDRDAPEDHAGDVSILRGLQTSLSEGLVSQLAAG